MDTRSVSDTLIPTARSFAACLPAACRPLARREEYRRRDAHETVLSCECGHEVTATDESELIEEIRRHARDAHGIAFSIEDALLVVLRSELEPESFSTSKHRREE